MIYYNTFKCCNKIPAYITSIFLRFMLRKKCETLTKLSKHAFVVKVTTIFCKVNHNDKVLSDTFIK